MARDYEEEKRMELTEHLAELRQRLIRSFLYLIAGAVVAYIFFTPIYTLISLPLNKEIKRLNDIHSKESASVRAREDAPPADPLKMPPPHNPPTSDDLVLRDAVIKWIFTHPVNSSQLQGGVFTGFADPFLVQLKLSVIFGFILVTPLITREAFLFLAPALTPKEREPLKFLIPLSILMLIFGITVAYLTLFYAIEWFLSFLKSFPGGATLLQNPDSYVLFFVKMMAAFGVAFQLPVVLMGGAFLNLITAKGLIKNWRWGVVISVLGGVFTPSNDLPSMALMSIPLLFLYFGSILLVMFVERSRKKSGSSAG